MKKNTKLLQQNESLQSKNLIVLGLSISVGLLFSAKHPNLTNLFWLDIYNYINEFAFAAWLLLASYSIFTMSFGYTILALYSNSKIQGLKKKKQLSILKQSLKRANIRHNRSWIHLITSIIFFIASLVYTQHIEKILLNSM